jgi:hypothetical protein
MLDVNRNPQHATRVRRVFDATEINPIVNHPEVFPRVAEWGSNPIDLAALIADHRNVMLMGIGGGIFFHFLDIGLYEAHTAFLPEHHGLETLDFARDAITWMMTNTDCIELVTKVPVFNRPAMTFTLAAGLTFDFERQDAWNGPDGRCGVRYYSMSYQRWAANAAGLVDIGAKFHVKLHAECSGDEHPDDLAHDQHVGAAIAAAMGGQVDKAIVFYNRWGARAGYAPIRLASRPGEPAIINIGTALIYVGADGVEVLKCL